MLHMTNILSNVTSGAAIVDEKEMNVAENEVETPLVKETHTFRPQPTTAYEIQEYTYSNPVILNQGCVITVVFMDPRIDELSFASLESVAAFVFPKERTCILIQTSVCQYQTDSSVTTYMAYQHLIKHIDANAGPLLKGMIQRGNVRMTVQNHTQYHVEKCDFFNANNAWLNYYYWDDYQFETINGTDVPVSGEFIAGQDSDFVLTIQRDTTLCTGLDALAWAEFSYVGAPWTDGKVDIPGYWPQLHSPPELQDPVIPPFPEFNNDNKLGPIGNGGLSLRSRYWMQHAIDYCPHTTFSNLVNISSTRTCFASYVYVEDVYFGTLLRGLAYNEHNSSLLYRKRAKLSDKKSHPPLKLPTMLEATYFSLEEWLFRDIVGRYQASQDDVDTMIKRLAWWDGKHGDALNITVEDGRMRYQRLRNLEIESGGQKPFVPIGLHNIWIYGHGNAREHYMKECPYLKDNLK